MTKVKLNNGNETKLDIFPWDIFKSDTISFFYQKILKYFNDCQKRNFSVLLLQLNQTMEMKQDQIFFHGTYSNISVTFTIGIFQFHCKIEYKQVKGKEIKGDMCKSDSTFPYLQRATLFN